MNWMASIKKLLRYPFVTIPLTGIALAVFLFFYNDINIRNFLIITILAFLASDALSWFFIRGGRGIFQFTLSGTQAQPKGYAFIIFFIVIIFVALIVSIATQEIIKAIPFIYPDFIIDLIFALALSFLVYLDMYVKFYDR
jgi:hypothetical protein